MGVLTPSDETDHEGQAGSLHGTVLCAAVVISAFAFSFRLTSFMHAKEMVLVLALLVIVLADPHRTPFPSPGIRHFAPLWIFLAWSLFAALVLGSAAVETYSVEEAIRLAIILLVASIAYEVQRDAYWRDRILDAIILASVIVAVLALAQGVGLLDGLFPRFDHYPQPMYSVFGNQDHLGGYLALGVTLVVYRFMQSPRNDRFVFVALLILLPALTLSGSRSAWLAGVIGVTVVLAMPPREWGRAAVIGIPSVALVLLLCAFLPSMTVHRLLSTFSPDDIGGNARLWFWVASVYMIGAHPFLGVGLGNFQFHSPQFQAIALDAPNGHHLYSNSVHTIHAHCDPLELLAETGPIGITLILWMFWRVRKCSGPEWGGLAALVVFGLLNAAVASAPHLLAGLLLLGSLKARTESPLVIEDEPPIARSLALLGVCVALMALSAWIIFIPSYQLRAAERHLESGEGEAFEEFRAAAKARWPDYEAKEAWAARLIESGDFLTAADTCKQARAGLDTGRIWFLNAVAMENLGDIETAREMYAECLYRWPRDHAAWARLLQLSDPKQHRELRSQALRWLDKEAIEDLF